MQTIQENRRQHETTITNQPKLMKEKQVSQEYNLSVSWLRNARWKGDGPQFVKIGGGIFYRPDDLTAYIEKNTRNSTSEY